MKANFEFSHDFAYLLPEWITRLDIIKGLDIKASDTNCEHILNILHSASVLSVTYQLIQSVDNVHNI